MSEFYQQYFCPKDGKYSLIIDDNSSVCYAYLLIEREVIGDVWLYNNSETADDVDWSNLELLPFLNPAKFIDSEFTLLPFSEETPIQIEWQYENDLIRVKISVEDSLIAILEPNKKPGWSKGAIKDGPLALKL